MKKVALKRAKGKKWITILASCTPNLLTGAEPFSG
jgi:hypothetical protein